MLKTALKFILYDKAKSLGALFGVIMSVFLVGQQTGIFIFLTNAMSVLVRNNTQYIWVVDNKTTNANALSTLDMRLGREIESIPGIEKVYPFVFVSGSAKFENGKSTGIAIIGTQAPDFAGGPWNIHEGSADLLIQEGAVFTEFFDKNTLGGADMGDYFEINSKKVFIAGQTKGIRGFGSPAYGFTTVERARSLAKLSPNKASAFLIKWKADADPKQVIALINQEIKGVRAWDSQEFANQTIITVLSSSGIAISFGTLIVFALIVGFVIIGLTLYSAAIDRIKDYGTLKAIGATNSYVRRLILTQAMIFAVVGFTIAYFLIEGFRNGIANTGTIFVHPLWLKITFFLVTLLIAFLGSLFAIRRITSLEPAQVFRG
jgi:putative ABC transport system permease protein